MNIVNHNNVNHYFLDLLCRRLLYPLIKRQGRVAFPSLPLGYDSSSLTISGFLSLAPGWVVLCARCFGWHHLGRLKGPSWYCQGSVCHTMPLGSFRALSGSCAARLPAVPRGQPVLNDNLAPSPWLGVSALPWHQLGPSMRSVAIRVRQLLGRWSLGGSVADVPSVVPAAGLVLSPLTTRGFSVFYGTCLRQFACSAVGVWSLSLAAPPCPRALTVIRSLFIPVVFGVRSRA